MIVKKEKLKIDFNKINQLILDVDGVLTDGTLFFDSNGSEIKGFNVQDGHGIKLWQRAGNTTAVITGRESKVVSIRCADLGIKFVYQSAKDKLKILNEHILNNNVKLSEICYIGDELVDIPVLKKVGLAVAVANAVPDALDCADIITEKSGGNGAVREVIDFLLKEKGEWGTVTNRYFE
ncbi:MAG: phenylphosphate carboxylase subunit delta [Chlamydiae bacterium]|nr:MAG: phenylphosphate carboxylase subunit delta [Chlamydiota bacterium]